MKRYIYLMRHGNPGQAGDKRRCLGSTDVPLSDEGRAQVEKSKRYIKSLNFNKVYCSPMKRCLETAECLGISEDAIIVKVDLREMAAGIWENLTFQEIRETYPDLYEARGKALGTFKVEGAESFKEAGERFGACLDEILKETNEDVLVIAHAGVIRGYLCALTGKSYDGVMEFPMPYAGITVLKEEYNCVKLLETNLRASELLDKAGIEEIYKKCKTPASVIVHMKKVAEAAMDIFERVAEACAFSAVEKMQLYKAAMLHDIYRTERNHALKAARFLRDEGYKDLSHLVLLHQSDIVNGKDTLELHEILFYADKIVQGDQIVSLKERFEKSFEKCKGVSVAEEKHKRLLEKAVVIQRKVEYFEKE